MGNQSARLDYAKAGGADHTLGYRTHAGDHVIRARADGVNCSVLVGTLFMIQYITAYAVSVVAFLAIDFVWLTQIAKRFYFDRLGHLLLDKPNLVAAGIFYAVYVIGIVIFAIAPALKEGSAVTALVYGALFGFFAYATYDMTNYATLRDWPVSVVVVDIAWGTFLTGITALIGYLGTRILT